MLDFEIYVCSYGQTKDPTIRCLFNLKDALPDYRFRVLWTPPDASLAHARSVACSDFLKNGTSNNLIFVDTDQMFGPGDVEDLLEAMCDGKEIIAGAYPMGSGGLAIHPWEDIVWDGHVEEIRYVSGGFMGITREALEQIKNRLNLPLLNRGEWCECYPFFELGADKNRELYLSEDWNFCDKAREAGLKVYIHTGILIGHIKERVIYAEPDGLGKLRFVR